MTASTVFINNRSQAIRLPAALRLPDNVKRVDVRARGCERVIAPAQNAKLEQFLESNQAGGRVIEVTVNLEGRAIFQSIREASNDGRLVINARAIK